MENERNYHTFPKKTMKLRDVIAMIRPAGYSNYDEAGGKVILCPECEEWTWVEFTATNCLLDVLGDLVVDSFNAYDNGSIQIWIETDEFNWINPKKGEVEK